MLMIPAVPSASYLAGGVVILIYGDSGIYWLIIGMICSFIKAVIDAWVLLVEINR